MVRLKHKLPTYAKLDHLALTTDELAAIKDLVLASENNFATVLETNKNLCEIHHTLAEAVYDNVYQISLTDNNTASDIQNLDECKVAYDNIGEAGTVSNLKNRNAISSNENSLLNEKNYNKKNEFYHAHSALFDSIFSRFKGIPTRVRISKMLANSTIVPHIDYDPSYSVRVIIPIISPGDCVNLFWNKNVVESVNMKEGVSYFLNTGYKHAVVNLSKHDRYTFTICVDGTQDIEHLIT